MIASYSTSIYVVLLFIDVILFVSLIFSFYGYVYPDIDAGFDLYVNMQIVALFCETILAIAISYLFSKPLIKLTAKTQSMQKHSTDKDSNGTENVNIDELLGNKLIKLSTKLLILSGISLGSTVLVRLLIIIAYPYCASTGDLECWFVYISYIGWPLDSLINIVCLLLAFKNGQIYYDKYCTKLHYFTVSKCVAKYYTKKVGKYANKETQSNTI